VPDPDTPEPVDPEPDTPEPATPEPARAAGLRPFTAGVVVAVVLAALGGFIVTSALDEGSRYPSASAPRTDPDASALGGIGLQQSDVTAPESIVLVPQGNSIDGPRAATLDFCDATYASEGLRTARLQVASLNRDAQTVTMSTEAVLYENPAATEQAFRELQRTASRCAQLLGEPGSDWPKPDGVQRLVYDVGEPGTSDHTVLVYLRRGRALLALYFHQPDGAQAPVAGNTTIEGITGVFQDRLAGLPESVTG